MGRRLATLAAAGLFVLVFAATPVLAGGGPLTHWTVPAAELGSLCGYTFTSGDVTDTFRTADAVVDPATGEILYIPAARVTLSHVLAERDGSVYKVVGGEIYSDLNGRLTAKLMFISPSRGIVDSINIVFRSYPTGEPRFLHDLGTCSFA